MDNKLDNDYISNAIEELIKVVGIKEDYTFSPFTKLLKAKKIEEAIQLVASHLRLPIKIQLSYVSDKYDPLQENKFESSQLTKTGHDGKGVGGITAQVYIPSYLPPFGSQALQNLPIKVKVSKDCTKYQSSFIAVIAHELSHILLASLNSKHKDNEIYTDLTPMILGFSNIIRDGRTTVEEKTGYDPVITSTDKNGTRSGHMESRKFTSTTTYGYLTDEQFVFAEDKIASINHQCSKSKRKIQQENAKYTKLVNRYERQYLVFNKYLEYVDMHTDQKINKKDVAMLIELHQQLYKDQIESVIRINKTNVELLSEKVKKLSNTSFPEKLKNVEKEIEEAKSAIKQEIKEANNKLDVLKKYVSITHRLRLRFSKI